MGRKGKEGKSSLFALGKQIKVGAYGDQEAFRTIGLLRLPPSTAFYC